jgi:hypothetical protein
MNAVILQDPIEASAGRDLVFVDANGRVGSMAFNLPMFDVGLHRGASLNATMPMVESVFVGDTHIVANLLCQLRAITANMTAESRDPTTLTITLPMVQMTGNIDGSRYNQLQVELPKLKGVMSAINNGLSDIDINLPLLDVLFNGTYHRAGGNYIDIDLPMLLMACQATGNPDAIIAGVLRHIRGQVR